MAKIGRPEDFTLEKGKFICEVIATSTKGLRWLHKNIEGFPAPETIYKWRFNHEEFRKQYTEAYKHKADLLAEEITDISDATQEDYIESDHGAVFSTENYQQRRLRIDTRKWIACKLLPKVYGDKVEHHVTIQDHESWLKESQSKLGLYKNEE